MQGKSRKNPEAVQEYEVVKTKFEAYTGDEPYLFVSYSHRDSKLVYTILDKLHDAKFRIWYDESCENGNDFREELRRKIEKAEAVLLFVSESSMNSPFCGMEVIVARENNKTLYPIILDDIPVPPAFQLLLANTHHGTVDDMDKLIKSLTRDLPPVAQDRLEYSSDRTKLTKCEDNGDSIVVDEGITDIADRAFKERVKLKHITLPSTIKTIGQESFRGCRNLEEMDIPASTLRINGSAYRDCVSMKVLKIHNDCIKIGERAFENCSNLQDVTLPNGLTEIYGGVFNSCRSLTSIRLPEKLTILGESAFSDCSGLTEVNVPESVTKIDDLVFNGCSSIKKVILHEGLRKIGKSAFKNCTSLTDIELPSTVTNISDAPFRGCSKLSTIKVSPKNKYYKSSPNKKDGSDHVLFNKNKSVLIAYPANSIEIQYDVPDSVVTISEWSFSECKKLNRIVIPDSVHEIGEGAFSNCSLLDLLEIPDSVEKIDDCAFKDCVSLHQITVPSSVKELGWGLFDGCENVAVKCEPDSEIYEYCVNNGIEHIDM